MIFSPITRSDQTSPPECRHRLDQGQIGEDERLMIIEAVYPRQRLSAVTSCQPLRQLSGILSGKLSPVRSIFFPPTTAVERSFVCPTSCAIMVGLKPCQIIGCTGACVARSNCSQVNGLTLPPAGMPRNSRGCNDLHPEPASRSWSEIILTVTKSARRQP